MHHSSRFSRNKYVFHSSRSYNRDHGWDSRIERKDISSLSISTIFFLSFLSYKMIDCIRDRFANAVDWQTSVIFVDQIRIQLNTAFKKAGN